MAATLDPTQFTSVWDESLNSGTGMLSRDWGPGINASVPGQITLNSTPDNQDSGTMVPPTGTTAGYGYGLFSFTLSMGQGDAPGPYALLWPGTDVWPGPELDLVEILAGGQAYSTIHWMGSDGSNQSTSYMLNGVDVKQVHTYAMDWEAGKISFYVDGTQMWTTTSNVPADAAHGGQNEAPGIGMQTWWSVPAQHGTGYDNTITLYDLNYATANAAYTDGTGTGTVTPPATGGGSSGGGTTTPPVTQTIGSGADSLVLKIAQDAWQGSAQYTVAVDGTQIGGTLTAGATYGAGDDSITVKGNFAAGAHTLTVTFINDAYGGSSAADRNLFVDGVSFNGTALAGATASLLSNGPASFAFTKAAVVTAGDTVPAINFGTPGTWGQKTSVWEGHATYGVQDYHTFGASGPWGTVLDAQTAPTTWAATNATHLAFDNFEQVQLDLHAAGTTPLDIMVVSAKYGSITGGAGNDNITWVAHSDASGANNAMVINTGAGNNTVHITAAGVSPLAQLDLSNNGSAYNPAYTGKWSLADVRLGSGADTVTDDATVRLVLHGSTGFATASGGNASDTFYAGKGGGDFKGGAGNDWFVLQAGDGHTTVEDFTSGQDHLKLIGLTAASVTTAAATQNGVTGLMVTYDAAHDSVFLAHVTKLVAADFVFA